MKTLNFEVRIQQNNDSKIAMSKYDDPKSMPKISNEYALMDNHFFPSRIKNEDLSELASIEKYNHHIIAHGDILQDLGFTETDETDLRKTIKSLDYSLTKI